MSAIAQYLSGSGKRVKGSDRFFAKAENDYMRQQLEREGVECFLQDGSGIDADTEAVIVSTAIEDTNVEMAKAKSMGIPIILRADLLAAICESRPTVAIAGTSGKSTVTAMLFHVLHTCGLSPSLITGAGLVSLQEDGRIGNAFVGKGKWLLIEADESDGTLVKYKPQIGLLLSIDKDHKELNELHDIFTTFRAHTQTAFVVNRSHALAAAYSLDGTRDFGIGTRFEGRHFRQEGYSISFEVADAVSGKGDAVQVHMPTIGRHNMENALACMAVANLLGVSVEDSARALATYPGIYRRHQCLGEVGGITVIDDYAHNPAKIAASIRACQPVAPKLLAWFQPHGYAPTRFIRKELVDEIATSLRPDDEIWMSEIFYGGGTALKDISAADLVADLQARGLKAYFVADRMELFEQLVPTLSSGTVLLLMGARDPGLEKLAKEVMGMVKAAKG